MNSYFNLNPINSRNLYFLIFFILNIPFSSISQSLNNQIIVKINYSFLNFDVINDKDLVEFPLKRVLSDRAKEHLIVLENQFPGIGDYELTKIFTFLTTNDTISVSRLGEKITIPPFWSVFVLSVDENSNVIKIINYLDEYSPLIDYAHLNYQVQFNSPPNDEYYSFQESLNGSPAIPNAGINIEEAWAIETGRPFIKVGIHDTGIDSTHEDINLLFGGTYYGSENNVPDWGMDQEGHGTALY